jgi:hypothetical protein
VTNLALAYTCKGWIDLLPACVGLEGVVICSTPPLTNKILPVLNFYFLRRRPNLLYFSGGILGLHKAFRNHFLMSLNLLASFSVHRNIANMSLWLGSHFPDRSLSHWNGLQIGSGTDLRYPEYRHTGFCRDIIYPKWYS